MHNSNLHTSPPKCSIFIITFLNNYSIYSIIFFYYLT